MGGCAPLVSADHQVWASQTPRCGLDSGGQTEMKFGRRFIAVVVGVATFSGWLPALVLPADAAPRDWRDYRPKVQQDHLLPHATADLTAHLSTAARPTTRPIATHWPSPATQTVNTNLGNVSGVEIVRGGGHPTVATPGFRLQVLSHRAAVRRGINGVLFRVTPTGAVRSGTRVALSYHDFANAVGGDYGLRLHLVQLPDCVLARPDARSCRTQSAVPSRNDGRRQVVSAPLLTADSGTATFAAVSGSSGANGTFEATSLAPSGFWSVSGASGSFAWQYPIAVPPEAAESPAAPNVSLVYNSGVVDGRVASSNNQSSPFGEGWSYNPGFVERAYRRCADDKTLPQSEQTADQCWSGQVVQLSLNGQSTSLVLDDTTKTWRLANDDGSRVDLVGAGPDGYQGEYWRVTTTDGVKYFFGRNSLPGADSATTTNSVWTTRVYGAHSGDPCYDSTFGNAGCKQAWRWNLDYVEDPHGNATAYYYNDETNNYGANAETTPVQYTRGGWLKRVDYGLRNVNNSIYGSPAPERVTFDVAERCIPNASFDCDPSKFDATNASNWPDTPQDQDCNATDPCNNHGPTYWSRKRVTAITTSVYNGSGYDTVDTYALSQSYPGGDPELILDGITRTGYGSTGSSITTPQVTFGYQLMDNRVSGYNNEPEMQHWRMTAVHTETGEVLSVFYQQAGRAPVLCTAATVPASPAQNTGECFPVYWTPEFNTNPILDYFHKYVVTEVDAQAANGVAPTRVSTFTYVGGAAWHYDDNELVKPAYRTYGQFRGFATVERRTGNPNTVSNGVTDAWTLTKNSYFRGMDGDILPTGARNVSVTDSVGDSIQDANVFADQLLESRTFLGDTATQVRTEITRPIVVATTATRARTGVPDLKATIVQTKDDRKFTNIATGGTRVTTTALTYDTVGREVQHEDTGTSVAPVCTSTSYADNQSLWIRDHVSETIVSSQTCPAVGTAPSPILSDTRNYYDGSTTLGDVPGPGDETRTDTAVPDGAGGTRFAKETTSYDASGRDVSSTVFAAAGDTRTTATAYTPALGGPLTKVIVTNPVGQSVTTRIDAGRGNVVSLTDVAGHVTSSDYDELGRLVSLWKPGQAKATDQATDKWSYGLQKTAPLSITHRTLVDPGQGAVPGYVTDIDLLDAFGTLRQSQRDAPNGGRIVSDNFTDSHGWTIRTNNRWFTTGAPSTTLITTADSGVDSRTL